MLHMFGRSFDTKEFSLYFNFTVLCFPLTPQLQISQCISREHIAMFNAFVHKKNQFTFDYILYKEPRRCSFGSIDY